MRKIVRFLGSVSTPLLALVHPPGEGARMPADVLRREFGKGGLLQNLLPRYTQAFITQIAQTAACNRAHQVEARLAKWLLMCQDRSHSKEQVSRAAAMTMRRRQHYILISVLAHRRFDPLRVNFLRLSL
jgi:hypothetical protein